MSTLRAYDRLGELSEPFPDPQVPWLDRSTVHPGFAGPGEPHAQTWARDGYLVLPRFVPPALLDAYAAAWERAHGPFDPARAGGWPHATPYMQVPELLDLCTYEPLADVLADLIGEEMGVHLNLTGWVSTQRDWHQDGYLNPDTTRDFYAAVWIALDDIDGRSGPFEYVPGSHRLPTIRQDRMLAAMGEPPGGLDGQWPKRSETILTPLFEEISAHWDRRRFLARKGDVLIWHARLLHRGTVPADPTLPRKALIAHYSGVSHRPDMPAPRRHGASWYFPLDSRVLV